MNTENEMQSPTPEPPMRDRRNNSEIYKHLDDRFDALEKMLRSGFPNGDLEAHRRVHEGYIKDAEDKASLWKSVREKTISGAVWGALLLLGTALWNWIKGEAMK